MKNVVPQKETQAHAEHLSEHFKNNEEIQPQAFGNPFLFSGAEANPFIHSAQAKFNPYFADNKKKANPFLHNEHEKSKPQTSNEVNQALVQRKVLLKGKEYTGTDVADEMKNDEFIRNYGGEKQLKNHLIDKKQTSVGLIKSLALWYRIPYLSRSSKQFFVLGESHAGVTGPMIHKESNVKKPLLYEATSGWNIEEFDNHLNKPVPTNGTVGLDENSSKLYRAIEAFNPASLNTTSSSKAPVKAQKIPNIPQGEDYTRETKRGTYKLVVKGEDGSPEFWEPKDKTAVVNNTYNTNNQALEAIKGLWSKVFTNAETEDYKKSNHSAILMATDIDALKFTYDYRRANRGDVLPKFLEGLKQQLLAIIKLKVESQYQKFSGNQKDVVKSHDDASFKNPLSPGNYADNYRNEYIYAAIKKAAAGRQYSFAAMGNNHLKALKDRLDIDKIPYITMEDFYDKYAKVAIDLNKK
ncbi:MAG: hypothetical protein HC913_14025 [Microscillaceae bacterium]|nr:hypothetical protein [Microscillaceae bacterium]